jgi:hypothetical protein
MAKTFSPLPPVLTNPEDEPRICIEINREWIPYIIGLLWPAKFPEYWAGTLEENRAARRNVQNLITILSEALECGDMANNCCDGSELTIVVQTRITIEGRLEISIDGGNVWTPSPQDPMYSIPAMPPPVTAGVSANKCDAATNGQEHTLDLVGKISQNLEDAITIFEFAVAIALAVLEIAVAIITGGIGSPNAIQIAIMIWGAATAAFTAGKAAFDAYWTDEVKDAILCALYCNIGDDGHFDEASYQAFLTDMQANTPSSPAMMLLVAEFKAVGPIGLNNMCSYGVNSGQDCSDCDCSCDLNNWVIQAGTIVSRTNTEIVLQSVLVSGSWVAAIHAPTPSTTCKMFQPSSDGEGSPVLTWGLPTEAFPSDPLAYPHSGIYGAGTCPNALSLYGFQGGNVGQVTFIAEGECEE